MKRNLTSKVYAMDTTPIINLLQGDKAAWELYLLGWMTEEGISAFRNSASPMQHAKAVLGRQDYCWTGSNRNWIWERPFVVDGEVWHWRLFASIAGWTLEIEVKDGREREIYTKALDDFVSRWRRK